MFIFSYELNILVQTIVALIELQDGVVFIVEQMQSINDYE